MSHYKSGQERGGGGEKEQTQLKPIDTSSPGGKIFLKIELSTHTVNLEEDDSSTPNSIYAIVFTRFIRHF